MDEHYKTYEFKAPKEAPFPKGMEIAYIPPAMPDFVGPMPQMILKEGEDYYNQREADHDRLLHEIFARQDDAMREIWKTHPECPHGYWPVSTQEVRCCQDLHGGQNAMLKEMEKHDVAFYIYDVPKYEPAQIDYKPGEWLNLCSSVPSELKDLIGKLNEGQKLNRQDVLVMGPAPRMRGYKSLAMQLMPDEFAHQPMWVEHKFPEHLHNELTVMLNGNPIITLTGGPTPVNVAVGDHVEVLDRTRLMMGEIFGSEMLIDMREVNLNMDDEQMPRNRAERRAGKRLDGSKKHKRKEWWNK